MLLTVSFAFELGKNNATIWHTRKSAVHARELQSFLSRVFGKKYTLKLSKGNNKMPGIFVGIQPTSLTLDVQADKDYTVIHAAGEQLYIFGNDSHKLTGTAYAVADFLEKHCGVRFLWPGELGTVVERRKPVTIKDGTDYYRPPFDLRMTSSFTYGMGLLTRKACPAPAHRPSTD